MKSYLTALILLFSQMLCAQVTFQSRITNSGTDVTSRHILSCRNGDYALIEGKKLNAASISSVIISRFNSCNNLIWSKELNASSISAAAYYDGSILLCVAINETSSIYRATNTWPCILKLDSTGKVIWTKKLYEKIGKNYSASFNGSRCISFKDGSCVIGGTFIIDSSYLNRRAYAAFTSLDKDGNILWAYSFQHKDTSFIRVQCLFEMPSKSIGFSFSRNGYSGVIPSGAGVIDSAGQLKWIKRLIPPDVTHSPLIDDVVADNYGNIYFTGQDFSYIPEPYPGMLAKIDKNGKLLWYEHTDTEYVGSNAVTWQSGLLPLNDSTIILAFDNCSVAVMNPSGQIRTLKKYALGWDMPPNLFLIHPDMKAVNDSAVIMVSNEFSSLQGLVTEFNPARKFICGERDTTLGLHQVSGGVMPVSVLKYNGFLSRDTVLSISSLKLRHRIICSSMVFPNADLGEDTIVCGGQTLKLNITDQNPGCQIRWSTGDTGAVLKVTKSGKYWVVSQHAYCTSSDTINVTFRDQIKTRLGKDRNICPYDSVELRSIDPAPVSFTMITPHDTISNFTSLQAKDTGFYYLVLNGSRACNAIDTFHLGHYPMPKSIAGPDTLLCYNQTYTMQGKGGISYKWIPARYLDNDTLANAKATLPNTQRYILVVRNMQGCSDTSTVMLKVRPPLSVKIKGNPAYLCAGQTLNLTASVKGGDSLHYQFDWTNDSLQGSSIKRKVTVKGWHKIIVIDGCSEPASDSVFVQVYPMPKTLFEIIPSDSALSGDLVRFSNHSINAMHYLWQFADQGVSTTSDAEFRFTDSGKYKVRLIAYNGNCTDTAFRLIYITDLGIYVPNAFSPNEDGLNDTWTIKGKGITDYSFEIYNRWGECIFHSTAESKGWNGKVENKGELVPEGVYVYLLTVKDISKRVHYLSGSVQVIR